MKLTHLKLDDLKPSALNVRKRGRQDIADLVPSIAALGLLQPLLVRPAAKEGEGFEIVAGQRRYHALVALAEDGKAAPVPCVVMQEGDDAAAIEASLAENVARLPMDEIDQYRAFRRLNEKGLSVEDIAARFGISERLVNQRLAIANIIAPILTAYRRDEITPDTLRILTMATKRQQEDWWKLFKDEDSHAPMGRSLKGWLFGGAQIPVGNALFDLADYDAPILSDLFGEERYFSDAAKFWPLQSKAIAAARERYLAEGWSEVVLLEVGHYWSKWEHRAVAKEDGGKVFITCTHDGEVGFHEGYLTEQEMRRREKAKDGKAGSAKLTNPELSKRMFNYLGLHRHAAIRVALLAHHDLALRLAVAHMICGSSLWRVEADPVQAQGREITASIAASPATCAFAEERAAIAKLLEMDEDADQAIVPRRQDYGLTRDLETVFRRLLWLENDDVLRILTFVMAETLAATHPVTDMLGELLAVDMRKHWQPDDGENCANAHVTETAKLQKKLIRDCLEGTRKPAMPDWLPRYMEFPMRGYTERFERVAVSALDGFRPVNDTQPDTETSDEPLQEAA